MLLILNLCFVAVCIVSIILTFPGPDPTALNEKVIEKVTNVSRRALSGFDISVFSQNQGKGMDKSHDAESLNNSQHEDAAEDLPLQKQKSFMNHKLSADDVELRYTLSREPSVSIPC